jgi:hypothetical protein
MTERFPNTNMPETSEYDMPKRRREYASVIVMWFRGRVVY